MTDGQARACGSGLAAIRRRYAAAIMDPGRPNARVEDAFATTPRENFLTPPPWTVFAPGGGVEGVTGAPADLYDDVLVVLDPGHGVNNGQPSLHAAWLATVDPKPGETVLHIGAGTGYYTAILAHLVAPGGRVHAYELMTALAARAQACLAGSTQVRVHARSGVGAGLPEADVVYVNAAASAPDLAWIRALKPGGRLIFPWQPTRERGGVALKVTRQPNGFGAEPAMAVAFIPCIGAQTSAGRTPRREDVWDTASLWPTATRPPDETATAVFEDLWFSREPVRPD